MLTNEEYKKRIRGWRQREGEDRSPPNFPMVFVSYRALDKDTKVAEAAAIYLQQKGVAVYFDKADPCLVAANETGTLVGVAMCIEIGLDQCNAFLGITTVETFTTSPWPAYEVGSARGRARFSKPMGTEVPFPFLADEVPRSHRIAHLIMDDVQTVPEFVRLGVPLLTWNDFDAWAEMMLREHNRIPQPGQRSATIPLPETRTRTSITFTSVK